jgi:hypothetical protein
MERSTERKQMGSSSAVVATEQKENRYKIHYFIRKRKEKTRTAGRPSRGLFDIGLPSVITTFVDVRQLVPRGQDSD